MSQEQSPQHAEGGGRPSLMKNCCCLEELENRAPQILCGRAESCHLIWGKRNNRDAGDGKLQDTTVIVSVQLGRKISGVSLVLREVTNSDNDRPVLLGPMAQFVEVPDTYLPHFPIFCVSRGDVTTHWRHF